MLTKYNNKINLATLYCGALTILFMIEYIGFTPAKGALLNRTNIVDTIFWKKNLKLNWMNFKATPVKRSSLAASSSLSIRIYFINNVDSLKVLTRAAFVPNSSWTKYKNDSILLSHEQGHFDIVEIYARILMSKLQEQHLDKIKLNAQTENNKQRIYTLKIKVSNDCVNNQIAYDKETNHGTSLTQQQKWNINIENRLKKLESFCK